MAESRRELEKGGLYAQTDLGRTLKIPLDLHLHGTLVLNKIFPILIYKHLSCNH